MSDTHTQPSAQRDHRPFAFLLAALIVLLDRLSKLWVVAHIAAGHAIVIIPRVFRITHVLNTGAAFSLFEEARNPETIRWLLVAFSLLAALVVVVLLVRMGRTLSATTIALALILGGAVGNLYDRMKLGHVVDFLEVHIIHYHWPDFNVADSAIVVGACLLLIEMLRPQREA
jgi:signal peptidase II